MGLVGRAPRDGTWGIPAFIPAQAHSASVTVKGTSWGQRARWEAQRVLVKALGAG